MILQRPLLPRVLVVKPRKTPFEFYAASSACAVVATHWDGDRTTVHRWDDRCECNDTRERRLEGFIFGCQRTTSRPHIYRLTDQAMRDLLDAIRAKRLRMGSRIIITRQTPHARAASRLRVLNLGNEISSVDMHLARAEVLEESLRRMFRLGDLATQHWLEWLGDVI